MNWYIFDSTLHPSLKRSDIYTGKGLNYYKINEGLRRKVKVVAHTSNQIVKIISIHFTVTYLLAARFKRAHALFTIVLRGKRSEMFYYVYYVVNLKSVLKLYNRLI